jgi:hypothetical protein
MSERYIGSSERKVSPTYEGKEAKDRFEYQPNPEADKKELDLARRTAFKEASEAHRPLEEAGSNVEVPTASKASKHLLKDGFDKTMQRTRSELSPTQKVFSNIIHFPPIEKMSDVVSTTIARPSSLLAASVSAFLLTGSLYLVARYYGFALSGSETIIAFIAGWVLGLIFDLIRSLTKKRR